jgi:eukaryotic-like serine/threonine-protein kinase
MEALIGQVINNFIIQEVIGQGGMGIVYRAYHPDLQRFAAVKIMRPELADQPGFYERFLQEARAAAHLDHPNIVNVINFGRYRESYYLMMDFIDGPNLRRLLNEHPAGLPLRDVLQIFIQLADVLNFAHAAGILHRDLKPDNILLTSSVKGNIPYRAIVTDFGLVKLARDSIFETQTGISVGTPAYMSPEQCRGERVDARADIYSLGVMMYEATVGQRPYPIRNLFDAARYHSSGTLTPLRAHNSSVPMQLDALVRRMLASDTGKRPAGAAEVVGTLQQLLNTMASPDAPPRSQVQLRIDSVLKKLIDTLDEDEVAGTEIESPATPYGEAEIPGAQPIEYGIQVLYHDQPEEKSYTLGAAPLVVGRVPPADIVLDRPERYVSKQHCEILKQGERILVRDLGSTNGTFLDGMRLERDVFYEWRPNCTVQLGPFTLALKQEERWPPAVSSAQEPPTPAAEVTHVHAIPVLVCLEAAPGEMKLLEKPITIGRAPDCDMVVNYAQVSKYHCRVERQGDRIELVDLNSTNGTYLGNKRLPANTPVRWDGKTAFTIGPATFRLGGSKSGREGT